MYTTAYCQGIPRNYISANVSFDAGKNTNSQNSNKSSSTSFNLYTNINWAVALKNNWMIGFTVGNALNTQNDENTNNNMTISVRSTSSSYSFGPLARKYFWINGSWSMFSEGQLLAGFGNSIIKQDGLLLSKLSDKQFEVELNAGINFSLNNSWRLELVPVSLRYIYKQTPKNEYNDVLRTESRFYFNSFLNGLNLGVVYTY